MQPFPRPLDRFEDALGRVADGGFGAIRENCGKAGLDILVVEAQGDGKSGGIATTICADRETSLKILRHSLSRERHERQHEFRQ